MSDELETLRAEVARLDAGWKGSNLGMIAKSLEVVALKNRIAEQDKALAAVHAWFESEDAGPSYPNPDGRDAPDGEREWRAWWEHNQALCATATDLVRAAVVGNPAADRGEG